MGAGDALRRVARDAREFVDQWPREGADLIAEAVTQQLRADTGGDGRLSRARGIPNPTVQTSGGSGHAEVTAGGTIWAWLETGTGTHRVSARAGGFLRTPYGPRRSVVVSGMAPKLTWTRATARVEPQVVADAEARFARMGG